MLQPHRFRHQFPRSLGLLLLFLALTSYARAHVIVQELEDMSAPRTILVYLGLGYQHILPLGLDHILFVLSLFLLSPSVKAVLTQSLAFTVAHTITLGLSMYHIVSPPARIVEPFIALSIVYVALENVISPRIKPTRLIVVFFFGLVHGMGFASALAELGLPSDAYFSSLISFNLGVELGQVTVILLAWLLLARPFCKQPFYRRLIVAPLSLIIAGIAFFWTLQRIFL